MSNVTDWKDAVILIDVYSWLDTQDLDNLLCDYNRLDAAVTRMAWLGYDINYKVQEILYELEEQDMPIVNLKNVLEVRQTQQNIYHGKTYDPYGFAVSFTLKLDDQEPINLDELYIKLKRAEQDENYELCESIKKRIDAYKKGKAAKKKNNSK